MRVKKIDETSWFLKYIVCVCMLVQTDRNLVQFVPGVIHFKHSRMVTTMTHGLFVNFQAAIFIFVV